MVSMNIWLRAMLVVMGVFSLTLGTIHFFFPNLLDFKNAVPTEGSPLKPLRLWFIHYNTLRSDVHGVAWVMNHAASYVLVSIGLLNIYWAITGALNRPLAAWIVGWWLLRAGSQLYLGRRRGDWLILAYFATLGIVQAVIAVFANG